MYVIHTPQKDKKSKYAPYMSKTFQKTVMRSLPNSLNATRQKDKFCCWLYKKKKKKTFQGPRLIFCNRYKKSWKSDSSILFRCKYMTVQFLMARKNPRKSVSVLVSL